MRINRYPLLTAASMVVIVFGAIIGAVGVAYMAGFDMPGLADLWAAYPRAIMAVPMILVAVLLLALGDLFNVLMDVADLLRRLAGKSGR